MTTTTSACAALALVAACFSMPTFAGAPATAVADRFATAPAVWRPYLIKAREADALADPLQRCLAFPDMPGNQWPPGLAAALCHSQHTKGITLAQVASYLDRGATAELDALYRHDLARHFSNADYSEVIHSDIAIFGGSDEAGALSERWLALAPDSAFANAARGRWLLGLAQKARGSKLISETPDALLRRMTEFGKQALPLFGRALELEPTLLVSHVLLLDLSRMLGMYELNDAVFAKAAAIDPACPGVTEFRMMALLPRWGGSNEAMDAYALELGKYIERRPLVALTAVMGIHDKGKVLFAKHQEAQAVRVMTPGAKLAPDPVLYEELGKAMGNLRDADPWLVLSTLLTAYRFSNDDFFAMRERADRMMFAGDYEWAFESLKPALALRPDDEYANLLFAVTLSKLGRHAESEQYYLKSGDEPTNREEAMFGLAESMFLSRQLDKADRYSGKFIEAYPRAPHGWLLRAQVKEARKEPGAQRGALERYLKVADRTDASQAANIDSVTRFLAATKPATP